MKDGYDWIAWKLKGGWSVTHAVIGADVMGEDVRGYYTMCGHIVPDHALEIVVGIGRRGPARSRPLERTAGILRGFMPWEFDVCKHCKREIEKLSENEED